VADASGKHLQCVVVTPERAVLDEPCDFVVLPLYDGELGILPDRAPLIGRLGHGELRLRSDNRVKRFYVDGGFAQVRGNVVSVLTQRAIAGEQIDTAKANEALAAAFTPGTSTAAKDKDRARAQLRVARRAAGDTQT
jgi:F-type H+-transporting ATPase subunit epsilon